MAKPSISSQLRLTLSSLVIAALNAAAADTYPVAPTIRDAHKFFLSLVSNNRVTAIYETTSRGGDICCRRRAG